MTKEVKMSKYVFNREAFLNLKTPQEKIEYLRGANLIRADLSYMDLNYMDLSYMDLSGLNFSGANFRYADLSYMDLSGLNFSGADLRHAKLSGAKLSGANFRYADLSGLNFSGADLRHADLPKHKNVTISGYRILIFEFHIQVGCHVFTHEAFLKENSEGLTIWTESEKELFRQKKEEIKYFLQEFLKNN